LDLDPFPKTIPRMDMDRGAPDNEFQEEPQCGSRRCFISKDRHIPGTGPDPPIQVWNCYVGLAST